MERLRVISENDKHNIKIINSIDFKGYFLIFLFII